ncbi:hypothetical protein HPT25_27270 [Bacillus sp. BRMEA1]|nr:hypothetical protein [Neobacillus endophyticus]NRD81024.1 hypothetical protein [Neobacillus endophyticus]
MNKENGNFLKKTPISKKKAEDDKDINQLRTFDWVLGTMEELEKSER